MAGARVAVIDDDPDAGEILARVLEQAGHLIGRLFEREAVLGALTTEPPDAVIIDLVDSNSSDPITLLGSIRNHPNPALVAVPVVIIGLRASNAVMAWSSGADGFLVRPFRAEELVAEVESAIDRPEAERGPFRARAHREALQGPRETGV